MALSRLNFALLAIFSLILLSGFLFSPLTMRSSLAASSTSGFSVSSFQRFNAYGQFSVNETLFPSGNSTTNISNVTFGFPNVFSGHIIAPSAYLLSGSSQTAESVSQGIGTNDSILFAVTLSSPLSSGSNSSLHFGFYVVDSFEPINGSDYKVPIMFYPSVSLKADKITSEIFLPSLAYDNQEPGLTSILQKQAFSQTVNGSAVIYDASATNISLATPSFSFGVAHIDPTQGGALDFSNLARQLSIGSDGSVTVRDTLSVKNMGLNTVSILNYTPLTNSSTVTLLPSSEPPLSNVASTNVSSNQLSLSSFNDNIEPNSAVTITVQYPLSSSLLSSSGGTTTVKIPASVPIPGALVDRYKVTVSAPSGIVLFGKISSSATNSTALPDPLTFTFRTGVGSAYSSAMPIAALIFIIVFLGAVLFKPKTVMEEDTSSTYDSLIKAVEDKVTATNDILGELKAKGTAITRNDLGAARPRIDELKTKSSSRIGVLRSQVASPSVTVQSALNQVAANDREFDRAVRDLLNVYDQFISRKMREDTFKRVLQNSERRMQAVTNSYLDSVHDLREEYEAEA